MLQFSMKISALLLVLFFTISPRWCFAYFLLFDTYAWVIRTQNIGTKAAPVHRSTLSCINTRVPLFTVIVSTNPSFALLLFVFLFKISNPVSGNRSSIIIHYVQLAGRKSAKISELVANHVHRTWKISSATPYNYFWRSRFLLTNDK